MDQNRDCIFLNKIRTIKESINSGKEINWCSMFMYMVDCFFFFLFCFFLSCFIYWMFFFFFFFFFFSDFGLYRRQTSQQGTILVPGLVAPKPSRTKTSRPIFSSGSSRTTFRVTSSSCVVLKWLQLVGSRQLNIGCSYCSVLQEAEVAQGTGLQTWSNYNWNYNAPVMYYIYTCNGK